MIDKDYELKYENLSNPNSVEFENSKILNNYADELIRLGKFIRSKDIEFVNGLKSGKIKTVKDADNLIKEIDKYNEEFAPHVELF